MSKEPKLERIEVPAEWQSHALVKGQYFYTVPPELLEAVRKEVGEDRFDPSLWRMESELSQINRDHRSRVGFDRTGPICFNFLRESVLNAEAEAEIRSFSQADADETIQQINSRKSSAKRDLRAYAGWLLTNPLFLEEHEQLLRQLHTKEGVLPIPSPGPMGFGSAAEFGMFREDSSPLGVVLGHAFAGFCSRWRLLRLCGPLLPLPVGRQSPAPLPGLSAQQSISSGYGMVAIPDTMPLPSEAELRAETENAVRGQAPDHLAEWMATVSSASVGKRALERYARMFELGHLYRLLLSRHPEAFRRKRSALRLAFASYFQLSEDAVRRGLEAIERRLGKGWYERFPIHRF